MQAEPAAIVEWMDPQVVGPRGLRRALGAFATGVTVVATHDEEGSVRAFTANSFTSVSLDPPLVLVCLAKTLGSFDIYRRTEAFSINVLASHHVDYSNAFAARDPAIKAEAASRLRRDEAPYLHGSLATFICSQHDLVEAGDHVILIGRVTKLQSREGKPLGYFRGSYVSLAES